MGDLHGDEDTNSLLCGQTLGWRDFQGGEIGVFGAEEGQNLSHPIGVLDQAEVQPDGIQKIYLAVHHQPVKETLEGRVL